jgi:hypothetical protein
MNSASRWFHYIENAAYCSKVAMGQGFLRALRFPSVIIIPPVLHTYLHPYVDLTRSTNGRILRIFQKSSALSKSAERWIGNYLHAKFTVVTHVN